jgi:ribonucleotide monophosphatase NagD (HAD superfamily)
VFTIDEEEARPEWSGKHMILSHTPLRDYVKEYENKFVLVSGIDGSADVLRSYGY